MLTEKLRQQKMLFPNNVVLDVKTFDQFKNERFLKLQTREKQYCEFSKTRKKQNQKEDPTKKYNYY